MFYKICGKKGQPIGEAVSHGSRSALLAYLGEYTGLPNSIKGYVELIEADMKDGWDFMVDCDEKRETKYYIAHVPLDKYSRWFR